MSLNRRWPLCTIIVFHVHWGCTIQSCIGQWGSGVSGVKRFLSSSLAVVQGLWLSFMSMIIGYLNISQITPENKENCGNYNSREIYDLCFYVQRKPTSGFQADPNQDWWPNDDDDDLEVFYRSKNEAETDQVPRIPFWKLFVSENADIPRSCWMTETLREGERARDV